METDAISKRIDALEETVATLQQRVRVLENVGAVLSFIRERKLLAREQKNDFVVLRAEDVLKALDGCEIDEVTRAMELARQPGDEKDAKTGAIRYYLKPKRI